jgi:hypothetical protein
MLDEERSNGSCIVWRQTANKRMVAKLQAIKAELRRRMHEPSSQVGERLQKVTSNTTPSRAIRDASTCFVHRLRFLWRRALFHRSQKGRKSWQRLAPLFNCWIPEPCVLVPSRNSSNTVISSSHYRRWVRRVPGSTISDQNRSCISTLSVPETTISSHRPELTHNIFSPGPSIRLSKLSANTTKHTSAAIW